MNSEDECDFGPALRSLKSRLSRKESIPDDFIPKVAKQFRDVNNKFYEPELVSIGPHHHGKPELKHMEAFKLEMLLKSDYISSLESRWKEVAEVVKEAQNCYAEEVIPDKDKFAEMLVLDCCCIIIFITDKIGYDANSRNSLTKTAVRDLLLFENQIPYFVLCKLWVIIKGVSADFVTDRVLKFFTFILFGGNFNSVSIDMESDHIYHILGLIHISWCPPKSQFQSVAPSAPTTQEPKDETITQEPKDDTITIPLVIPSASKLKEANVKFKAIEGKAHVEFEEDCGKLLLPRLVIDNGIGSLLINLIAYEQMYLMEDPNPITDYAVLLDILINDATDIQTLSKCGIIQNMLGSDEEVANFVNQLTCKILYQNKKFIYSDLFDRINTYYDKRNGVVRWNKAISEFREKYFNSPWSFIAAVAATVLLVLTVAQTVFAAQDHFKRP